MFAFLFIISYYYIMMSLFYSIGFLLYALSATLSYSERAKVSAWYFPVGIAMAIVANLIWLHIAKISTVGSETFVRGLIWDSMIVMCYVIVPILFYGVRLNGIAGLGAVMIVVGIFLTKMG
jgi:hypothetical protein